MWKSICCPPIHSIINRVYRHSCRIHLAVLCHHSFAHCITTDNCEILKFPKTNVPSNIMMWDNMMLLILSLGRFCALLFLLQLTNKMKKVPPPPKFVLIKKWRSCKVLKIFCQNGFFLETHPSALFLCKFDKYGKIYVEPEIQKCMKNIFGFSDENRYFWSLIWSQLV